MKMSNELKYIQNRPAVEKINKKIKEWTWNNCEWIYVNKYYIQFNKETNLYDLYEEEYIGGGIFFKAPRKMIEEIELNEFDELFEQFKIILAELNYETGKIKKGIASI